MTPRAATPVDTTNDDGVAMEKRKNFTDNFADESTSSLKRANRPPDLNLSPGRSAMGIPVELANQKLVGVAAIASLRSQSGGPGDFDPTRSSTPTKQSGSISERVSLVYKKNACKCISSISGKHLCRCCTCIITIQGASKKWTITGLLHHQQC